jgi:hypothetical protein
LLRVDLLRRLRRGPDAAEAAWPAPCATPPRMEDAPCTAVLAVPAMMLPSSTAESR